MLAKKMKVILHHLLYRENTTISEIVFKFNELREQKS